MHRLFNSFDGDSSFHFYLRVHPNLMDYENTQIREIRKLERYGNLTIIMPESKIHTYSLLDSCHSIITFGSTVGVEACYWGKPSILAARAIYEDLNCCYIPRDHADLIRLLKADIRAKSDEGCYKYGYWELMRGETFKFFQPIGYFDGIFKGKRLSQKSFLERGLEKIKSLRKEKT